MKVNSTNLNVNLNLQFDSQDELDAFAAVFNSVASGKGFNAIGLMGVDDEIRRVLTDDSGANLDGDWLRKYNDAVRKSLVEDCQNDQN